MVPGVELQQRSTEAPQRIHALRIDLTRPEISLVATRPADKSLTVTDFAQRYTAAAAINGNYSNDAAGKVCGLAVGDGEVWGGLHSYQTGAEDCRAALVVDSDNNRAEMVDHPQTNEAPAEWVSDAVTGRPWLVRDGAVQAFDCGAGATPLLCDRYARSALGLTEGGDGLLMVVVDGISEQSVGMTAAELASLMADLGAHGAFALNYSSAASLWLGAGGGLLSCTGGGGCTEAPVVNHLGVRVDASAVWFAAEHVAQAPDPPDPIAPGVTVERAARYRNVGRATWSASSAHPVVLAPVDPRDRESAFFDPETWQSASRAVPAEGEVRSGAEATFLLPLRGAGRPGSYTEAFAPVALGAGPDGADLWLDEQPVSWNLVVDGPADGDGDGHSEETDCDDTNPEVFPGAAERCNGRDDDCSGDADDGVVAGRQATVVWTARASGVLTVNGEQVDRSEDWRQVRVAAIDLRPGANVLGLRAERGTERGGVLIGVLLPDGDVLPSNSRWQAAAAAPEGWDTAEATPAGFSDAGVSAYWGQEPWEGNVQGWPEDLASDGFIWIWTAAPDTDDTVYLRREIREPTDCPSPGDGVCSRGAWRCVEGEVRCEPLVQPGERSETCNGEDDDCDGLVDEGVADCATSEDAGPPLPDLGTDLPTAELQVGMFDPDDPKEAILGTGCGCSQHPLSDSATTPLLLRLAELLARPRRAHGDRSGAHAAP